MRKGRGYACRSGGCKRAEHWLDVSCEMVRNAVGRLGRATALAGVVAGAAAFGCANPEAAVGFREPDPAARLRAIRQAAETRDRAAIGPLIGVLESDDAAERLLAIRSLERLTGQTLGYDHAGPVEERRAAARKWAEWYSQQSETTKKGSSVSGT